MLESLESFTLLFQECNHHESGLVINERLPVFESLLCLDREGAFQISVHKCQNRVAMSGSLWDVVAMLFAKDAWLTDWIRWSFRDKLHACYMFLGVHGFQVFEIEMGAAIVPEGKIER
jgi:hypothetical protein